MKGRESTKLRNIWILPQINSHTVVDKWNVSSVMNIDGGVFRMLGQSVFYCGEVLFEFASPWVKSRKGSKTDTNLCWYFVTSTSLAATSAVEEPCKYLDFFCISINLILRFCKWWDISYILNQIQTCLQEHVWNRELNFFWFFGTWGCKFRSIMRKKNCNCNFSGASVTVMQWCLIPISRFNEQKTRMKVDAFKMLIQAFRTYHSSLQILNVNLFKPMKSSVPKT